MTNRFLLCYDRAASADIDRHVLAFVKNHRFIIQWAQIFSGAFFIKSRNSLRELDDTFTEFFSPSHYVLSAIGADPSETDGFVNSGIWEWLAEDIHEPLKLTSPKMAKE